jgi:hypothetical protein
MLKHHKLARIRGGTAQLNCQLQLISILYILRSTLPIHLMLKSCLLIDITDRINYLQILCQLDY